VKIDSERWDSELNNICLRVKHYMTPDDVADIEIPISQSAPLAELQQAIAFHTGMIGREKEG
jgi:hypothetical protein